MTAVTARPDHTRVEILHGPAPLRLRVLAALIDLVVVLAPVIVGALIVHSLGDTEGAGRWIEPSLAGSPV